MKLQGRIRSAYKGEDGQNHLNLDILPTLDAEHLEELESGDWVDLRLTSRRRTRTLEQNALLWATLHEMDKAVNGMPTEEGRFSLYYWALEKAGLEYDDVSMTREVFEVFRKRLDNYRLIRVLREDGNTLYCRCYPGVSQFDKVAMANLLEIVLAEAQRLGIPRRVVEAW